MFKTYRIGSSDDIIHLVNDNDTTGSTHRCKTTKNDSVGTTYLGTIEVCEGNNNDMSFVFLDPRTFQNPRHMQLVALSTLMTQHTAGDCLTFLSTKAYSLNDLSESE